MIKWSDYFVVDSTSHTGLRWLAARGQRVKAGDCAGNPDSKGYFVVGLLGKLYKVHRIVAVLTGHLDDIHSPMQIDHINGIVSDNSPANLRAVSIRQNQQNQARHRRGALLGCCLLPSGRWRASIKIGGATINLGHYGSADAANAAYLKALEKV